MLNVQKVRQTMNFIQHEGLQQLGYATRGVGGDESCHIEVTVDAGCASVQDVFNLSARDRNPGKDKEKDKEREREKVEGPTINTVKVCLAKIGSLSQAMDVCAAARSVGWAVIVGNDEELPQSGDNYLADFAVAVGAGQLAAGGMGCGACICNYNRLMDISRQDATIPFAGRNFRR